MSRSSLGFRRSFNTGRKLSRENRKDGGTPHAQQRRRSEHSELHEKRQRSRHDNSEAEKATRSIFGDVPLTDTERRYLWAAQSGNLPALEMLVEEAGTFNLACRDYLGRTALQLAVLGEHYDCIQLLLEKSRMDVIEEGLLHAIKTENVKICDMFLGHPFYSNPRSRLQLDFHHGFYDQEDNSSSFAPDITPVVLAAQCNNFDIVHMLIQKGFTIPTPHNYFCFCTECHNHKTFDRVVHSKSRLNAYRGLASTAYLSLSCDDPIHAAFELSRSLQKLAEREKEHKNEYRGLSEKCKNFAVDLLDQCRTHEEVMAALHGGTDTRDLMRIKMAIRYEQKKFIAHASCQEHLASMWYAGASWFQHQNFPIKLVLVPLGIVFIPVTAIVYVFLPYSKIGKILKSPFMKFMNYICSYTAFLVLLFLGTRLSSFKSVHLFNGHEGVVNSLIMFYVLGMFWAECKQLWEEGVKGYFSQMWNYMDITMLALYTAGYSIEGVIYTKTRGLDTATDNNLLRGNDNTIINPQILSKILFSVANVLSFARIAYILPASETFGQLQISYGRMLQDVAKFIFIYFTVMIAFICGLTSLYSISDNEHFSGLSETTGTLFWAAFGMGNSKAPQIITSKYVDKGSDDDDKETDVLQMVQVVGYILYGVYILGAVVVLINMLIAMMSNTFEEIQKSEDSEWKFARAKLWISFIEQGTTLPIPFNIIPTPKSILKLSRWFRGCTGCDYISSQEDGDTTEKYELEYKAIMHRVVLRYIHKMKFEKKGDSLKDDILDTREEVIYQLHSMYGRLSNRLELLERDLFGVGISKASPGAISRRSSPGLTYSRSVSSHTVGSRDRQQTLRAVGSDLSLPVQAFDNIDLLFNRRSRYRIRSAQDTRERSTRASFKESSLPPGCGTDRQSRDSSQDITDPGLKEMTKSDNSVSKTNLSDGDKRSRKPGNVQQPIPLTSVSSTLTEGSSRKESLASVASQSLSDPDHHFMARRGGSIRLRSDRDDRLEGFSPRPGSERRRRRTDGFRDSWRSDAFALNAGGHRLGQGVIKESSMEEQLTQGERETSFIRNRGGLAYSPLLRGSGKRSRETYNHPNIDAPFSFPHRSNRDSATSNTFTEYLETRPQTRDTIQGLVLDIQKVPFAQLNSKDGEEKWAGGTDLSGSQGSVFTSSPPAEAPAAVRKYGRQDSQSSVSTIGRLAAAATARVFPLDPRRQCQQQEMDSDKNSGSHDPHFSFRQPRPEGSSVSSSGIPETEDSNCRFSETSALPHSCPTTIVTISGSLSKAAHNAMNSAIYPALYSNGSKNVTGCNASSPNGLPTSPSSFSTGNENEKRHLLGPDEFYGHHRTMTGIPDNEQTSRDSRFVSKDSTQTPASTAICINGRTESNSCKDPSCLQCRARMLEPLSLAQTECLPSSYASDLKTGHVNQVYVPETPISPIEREGFDTFNKQDCHKDVHQQRSKNVGTGGNNQAIGGRGLESHTLATTIKTSNELSTQSDSANLSYCKPFPQVHFDQTERNSDTLVSQNEPSRYDNEKSLSSVYHSTAAADKMGLTSPTDIYLEDTETTSPDQTVQQLGSHSTTHIPNHFRISPVLSSLTSPVTSIAREEQYFSDNSQHTRNHPVCGGDSSDFDDNQNIRTTVVGGRHSLDCQPYQKGTGRYRKRGSTGIQYQHPSSLSGSAAGRHKRSLQHHSGRDPLAVYSSQKSLHPPAETYMAGNLNFRTDPEESRATLDPHEMYSNPLNYQHASHAGQFKQTQQQQPEQYTIDQEEEEEQQNPAIFFISDPNSLPPSPEVSVSTAAAMFIPAMATNLLPFPLPIQSSGAFSHKPVTKQQAKQLSAEPEASGADRDKLAADATSTTPRKKKTSLVALVRGRRSDKGKSKRDSKHSRSLSLNRSTGSSRGKVATLHHQRSKEI